MRKPLHFGVRLAIRFDPHVVLIEDQSLIYDSVAIFRETRRDIRVPLGSEKLATSMPPAAHVRPASATARTPLRYAARHASHK